MKILLYRANIFTTFVFLPVAILVVEIASYFLPSGDYGLAFGLFLYLIYLPYILGGVWLVTLLTLIFIPLMALLKGQTINIYDEEDKKFFKTFYKLVKYYGLIFFFYILFISIQKNIERPDYLVVLFSYLGGILLLASIIYYLLKRKS